MSTEMEEDDTFGTGGYRTQQQLDERTALHTRWLSIDDDDDDNKAAVEKMRQQLRITEEEDVLNENPFQRLQVVNIQDDDDDKLCFDQQSCREYYKEKTRIIEESYNHMILLEKQKIAEVQNKLYDVNQELYEAALKSEDLQDLMKVLREFISEGVENEDPINTTETLQQFIQEVQSYVIDSSVKENRLQRKIEEDGEQMEEDEEALNLLQQYKDYVFKLTDHFRGWSNHSDGHQFDDVENVGDDNDIEEFNTLNSNINQILDAARERVSEKSVELDNAATTNESNVLRALLQEYRKIFFVLKNTEEGVPIKSETLDGNFEEHFRTEHEKKRLESATKIMMQVKQLLNVENRELKLGDRQQLESQTDAVIHSLKRMTTLVKTKDELSVMINDPQTYFVETVGKMELTETEIETLKNEITQKFKNFKKVNKEELNAGTTTQILKNAYKKANDAYSRTKGRPDDKRQNELNKKKQADRALDTHVLDEGTGQERRALIAMLTRRHTLLKKESLKADAKPVDETELQSLLQRIEAHKAKMPPVPKQQAKRPPARKKTVIHNKLEWSKEKLVEYKALDFRLQENRRAKMALRTKFETTASADEDFEKYQSLTEKGSSYVLKRKSIATNHVVIKAALMTPYIIEQARNAAAYAKEDEMQSGQAEDEEPKQHGTRKKPTQAEKPMKPEWPEKKLVEYKALEMQLIKTNRKKTTYAAKFVTDAEEDDFVIFDELCEKSMIYKEERALIAVNYVAMKAALMTADIINQAKAVASYAEAHNMPAAAAIDAIHSGQAEVEEEDEEEEDKAEEEEEEEEFADARATNDESQEEEEDEEEEAEVVKTPEEAEVVKTPSHRKIRAAEDSYTVEERTRLQNEYPDGKLPNANEYTDGTYTLRNFVWTKEGSNMTKRERTHDLFVDTAAVYAKVTISTVDGDKILKWDHNINQGTLLSRMFTTVSDDTDILSEVLMTIQKYNTIPVEFPEFAAELKKKGIDLKYLKTAMKELGKKALAYDMVNAMEKRGLANNDEYVGGFYTSTENDFDDIIPKMETALKLLWVVMTSTVGKFGDTIALRQNAALTAITNGIANRFGKLGLHQESPIFAKWKEVLVTMNDLVRSDANTTEAPSFENDANNICRSGTSSENYKLLNGLTSFLMTEKNDVDRLADKYVSVVDIVWQFHKVRRFVIGHIRGGKPDDKSVNTQNHKFSAGDDCFETSDAVSRLARMFL